MDEATLREALGRAKGGDRGAFAELYTDLSADVRRFCRSLLRTVEEAEDAAGEAFLRAQLGMSTYDDARPFPAWLLGIARNICVDRLRQRAVERKLFREQAVEEREAAASGPPPVAALIAREEEERLRAAMDALPDRYRAPLMLRFYADLSYDEIAQELDLKRSHVGVLLFRARQELRRSLAKYRKERTP